MRSRAHVLRKDSGGQVDGKPADGCPTLAACPLERCGAKTCRCPVCDCPVCLERRRRALTRPDRAETPEESRAMLGLHRRLRAELLPGERLAYLRRRQQQAQRELELGECSLADVGDTELLEQIAGAELLEDDGLAAGVHDREDDPDHASRDRVADVIRCALLGWQRVAPGEFCNWRPILDGLARFGLDAPELIDAACARLGVERCRCGRGERWRLP